MLIFHIAERPRWEAAQLAGSYAWSTLGRSLDDEGFLHASRAEQVAGVIDRFYRNHDGDLLLLTIDTDLLTSPWREDQVGDATFPHIYGPLNPSAVIEVRPLAVESGTDGDEAPPPRADPPTPTATSAAPAAQAAPATPTQPRSLLQLWLAEFLFRIAMAVFVMAVATAAGFAVAAGYRQSWGLVGLVGGAIVAVLVLIPVNRRHRARSSR